MAHVNGVVHFQEHKVMVNYVLQILAAIDKYCWRMEHVEIVLLIPELAKMVRNVYLISAITFKNYYQMVHV